MTNEFEVVSQLGEITRHENGWSKELNIVSWDGKDPVFDVRDWSPDHKHPARGLTLGKNAMNELVTSYKKWRSSGNTAGSVASKPPKHMILGTAFSVVINGSIGSISPLNKYGWRKEINVVSWNNGEPKIDIREWSKDHNRMSRGITLTEEEADRLVELFEKNTEKAIA